MFRYVALIWNPSDTKAQTDAFGAASRLSQTSHRWQVVMNVAGLQVLSRASPVKSALTAYRLARRSGVVLGTVFHRSGSAEDLDSKHDPEFDAEETERIVRSAGRTLMDSYWGRFVAIVTNSDENVTWVVKDPTGRLPCFVTQWGPISIVFSYLPDCVALGVPPFRVNWSYIAARIALGSGRPDDTGLEDVSEVCGGECLAFRAGHRSRHLYWDPNRLFGSEPGKGPAHLAQSLRTAARACASAWASTHDTMVHRLSGGLDSSIVLTCLAEAPSRPRILGLTYYRPGGVSDERPWARLAAQRSGCEHIEYARTANIDFAALSSMRPTATPPLSSSFLETDPTERELANRYHATAICSGDGGDSLFGSTSARFSVLEYARRRGLRPELLRLASDVALLSNQTVWSVLGKTLRYALFDHDTRETQHLREARRLAAAEVREPILAQRQSFSHPWFRLRRLPPGASEILSFLTLPDQFYPPLSDPEEGGVETIFPLLSQPLVELCVSIPSYLHFEQGRDRGLARRAFADDVPAAILARTWKDRVQGFPEEILHANLPYFRSILLDGILVKERFLDAKALETTLSGNALKDTASVGEILDHVLVECWLRSWTERPGSYNCLVNVKTMERPSADACERS